MTVRDHLIAARALIERGWCQRNYATDARGLAVEERDPSACAWCVLGAVWATEQASGSSDVLARLREAAKLRRRQLHDWNDAPGRTRADVLALFDRVIAAEAGQ